MSTAHLYLPPMLAMVGLSFAVAFSILVTRFIDLIANKVPRATYEDSDQAAWPAWVVRPTRQLANLFEFPVLFYALLATAMALRLTDPLLRDLAWFYVGLRVAHALSHTLLNRLWVRMPIFATGNLVLAAMWIRLAIKTLGPS
jgi:hypothetical protein